MKFSALCCKNPHNILLLINSLYSMFSVVSFCSGLHIFYPKHVTMARQRSIISSSAWGLLCHLWWLATTGRQVAQESQTKYQIITPQDSSSLPCGDEPYLISFTDDAPLSVQPEASSALPNLPEPPDVPVRSSHAGPSFATSQHAKWTPGEQDHWTPIEQRW